MSHVRLYTTKVAYEKLHENLAKLRGNKATLNRQDVMNLLMDHSIMLAKLTEWGVKIETKT